jgi:hypothetical protein
MDHSRHWGGGGAMKGFTLLGEVWGGSHTSASSVVVHKFNMHLPYDPPLRYFPLRKESLHPELLAQMLTATYSHSLIPGKNPGHWQMRG